MDILTAGERQQINHQQNNISKSIYTDKHNDNTAHYGNTEVGQRRDNQQDRIANEAAQWIDERRSQSGARRESRAGHQSTDSRRPRAGSSGKLTGQEKGADQSRTEPHEPHHLSPEALIRPTGNTQELPLIRMRSEAGRTCSSRTMNSKCRTASGRSRIQLRPTLLRS